MKLRHDLAKLLNTVSRENVSNTPDYILADFLLASLQAFEDVVIRRETWWGRTTPPSNDSPRGGTDQPSPPDAVQPAKERPTAAALPGVQLRVGAPTGGGDGGVPVPGELPHAPGCRSIRRHGELCDCGRHAATPGPASRQGEPPLSDRIFSAVKELKVTLVVRGDDGRLHSPSSTVLERLSAFRALAEEADTMTEKLAAAERERDELRRENVRLGAQVDAWRISSANFERERDEAVLLLRPHRFEFHGVDDFLNRHDAAADAIRNGTPAPKGPHVP